MLWTRGKCEGTLAHLIFPGNEFVVAPVQILDVFNFPKLIQVLDTQGEERETGGEGKKDQEASTMSHANA